MSSRMHLAPCPVPGADPEWVWQKFFSNAARTLGSALYSEHLNFPSLGRDKGYLPAHLYPPAYASINPCPQHGPLGSPSS